MIRFWRGSELLIFWGVAKAVNTFKRAENVKFGKGIKIMMKVD